ncbi:MAG: hypothetical protein R6W91_02395 [Thermoplasmata archaeon]
MKRTHYLQYVPVMLLATLSAWHLYSYFVDGALGGPAHHFGVLAVAFIMAIASLFFRNSGSEITLYLEGIINPARPQLIGLACFMLGGLHLITITKEPIFMKMGYLVILLAFFETAGMANRFLPAMTGDPADVTRRTLRRLILNQAGMLALVFCLSVALLYLSLMADMGFFETWTVALLSAMMMLALALMVMVRRI